MSQFGYDREAKNSLKKTLPILKQDLLADKNKKPDPVLMKKGVIKPLKGKKLIEKKEKELKEILRPLMSINTKRPRSKICYFSFLIFIYYYYCYLLYVVYYFVVYKGKIVY